MTHRRASTLAALAVLGAGSLACAQDQPPPNTGMPPVNSTPAATPAPPAAAAESQRGRPSAASAPQVQSCLNAEKAKNSGLSDAQITRKCTHDSGGPQGQ